MAQVAMSWNLALALVIALTVSPYRLSAQLTPWVELNNTVTYAHAELVRGHVWIVRPDSIEVGEFSVVSFTGATIEKLSNLYPKLEHRHYFTANGRKAYWYMTTTTTIHLDKSKTVKWAPTLYVEGPGGEVFMIFLGETPSTNRANDPAVAHWERALKTLVVRH